MSKSKMFLTHACIMVMAMIITVPAFAIVTFSDGTFNNTDWSLTELKNDGLATANQIGSGGNPGTFRQTVNTIPDQNYTISVYGVSLRNNAIYNPSTQGAIISVDYSEDAATAPTSGSQVSGPAILQGGQYFLRCTGILTPNSADGWQTQTSLGLLATDFCLMDATGTPNPTMHPNFSSSGGQMQLGFFRGNVIGPHNAIQPTAGIDNWSVTINNNQPHAVPTLGEWGMIIFIILAVLGAVYNLRRQRSAAG